MSYDWQEFLDRHSFGTTRFICKYNTCYWNGLLPSGRAQKVRCCCCCCYFNSSLLLEDVQIQSPMEELIDANLSISLCSLWNFCLQCFQTMQLSQSIIPLYSLWVMEHSVLKVGNHPLSIFISFPHYFFILLHLL